MLQDRYTLMKSLLNTMDLYYIFRNLILIDMQSTQIVLQGNPSINQNNMDSEQLDNVNQIVTRNKYKAIAKISEGSYGQVYAVLSGQQEKPYAMKIIDRKKLINYSKEHQALIEGFVLQKLRHPGIVNFKEMIVQDEWILHVMELCPHGNISRFINKVTRNMQFSLDKRDVVKYYLSQILQTIDFLHERVIIHRDLKPENIMIGTDMKIRFIDFGTAKPLTQTYFNTNEKRLIEESSLAQNKTARKSFVGSLHYVSPQGTRCEHSAASDIWAFGVIMYKIFLGRHPFEGQNKEIIFEKIKKQNVKIDENIPSLVKQIIISCLKKDPSQRPSAKSIKLHPYFQNIEFDKIFKIDPPIIRYETNSQVLRLNQQQSLTKFQINVQKRMLFGNFKPRLLTIRVVDGNLYMAYKYPITKVTKSQFPLNMSDYAICRSKDEFKVMLENDKTYYFRVSKWSAAEVVQEINEIIRKHYSQQ